MIAAQPALVLGAFLVLGCTAAERTKRAPTDEHHPPPALPKRCNHAVADAQAAIDLAEAAKRAAGFADVHSVDGPKALVTEGLSGRSRC